MHTVLIPNASVGRPSAPPRPPSGGLITVTRREAFRQQGKLWSDDILELEVDGLPAGYMVLSHIPAARIKQEMPLGIVDYIRTIKGHSRLRVPLEELPDALRRHVGLPPDASGRRVKAALRRMHGEDYADFLHFHVDKPFVAYTRLYSEWDFYTGDHTSASSVRQEPLISYRKLGLGAVLYQHAALWLAERGFLLHADDNQNDEGRAVWKRLAKQFPGAVVPEGYKPSKPGAERCRLDGTKLGEIQVPEWAQTTSEPGAVRTYRP